jgi:signal transduction histidine kinase
MVDERLLADVVHKIKNSLGGIGGFATLLERDLEPDDPKMRLTKRIQDGVTGVNDLVIDLMTLVRNDKPEKEKVRLVHVLKSVWRNFSEEKNREKEHVIQSEDPKDKMEMTADLQMMKKMIHHAVQFSETVGSRMESIFVGSHRKGRVTLEFRFLNGATKGKPVEDVHKFLENGEPIGARLSLAIVHKMAKLHGGKVALLSRENNQKALAIQLSKRSEK